MRPRDRGVWLLIAFSFPVGISIGLRMVFLMPYLAMLGFSEARMGLVATVGSLAMAILALPFGMLSDLKGRKPFLLASRLLAAFSDLLFFLRKDLASLVLANFLGGVGSSMASANRQAFLAYKARGPQRGSAFTASSMAFSIGCVTDSLLAGFPDLYAALYRVKIVEATRLLFLFCAFLCLLLSHSFSAGVVRARGETNSQPEEPWALSHKLPTGDSFLLCLLGAPRL